MIRPFTLQLWELYYKSTPGCLVPPYLTEWECLVWREDFALISALTQLEIGLLLSRTCPAQRLIRIWPQK